MCICYISLGDFYGTFLDVKYTNYQCLLYGDTYFSCAMQCMLL